MVIRRVAAAALLALGVSSTCLAQSTAATDGSDALAERFVSYAHSILRTSHAPGSLGFIQTAALYRAASRLDPDQPRYARALVDTELEIGDAAAAADALKKYLHLQRDDQLAQVQLIDLYVSQMQTAQQKLDYLRGVVKRTALPVEVRSAAAYRAANLLALQSETDEAISTLNSALVMNPLNVPAMKLKYQLTQQTATPLDRVNQLMNLLQADPANPETAQHIAEQLADLGVVKLSTSWYTVTESLYAQTHLRPTPAFARGMASEMLIGGHADETEHLLSIYLPAVPNDTDAWLIRAAANRSNSAMLQQTSNALLNHLAEIRMAIGATGATTRPLDAADGELPDLSNDLPLLRAAGIDAGKDYINALAALAWFDLYFRRDATPAQPILKMLGTLLADDDVQLVRLRGWALLDGRDPADAQTAFKSVADRDAMAQLGLILIDLANPQTHADALARAQALVNANPSGLRGAILASEFFGLGIKVQPAISTDTITNKLELGPAQFLPMLDRPQLFYTLRIEPSKTAYDFNEPILVRVSFTNVSGVDLPIGDDCGLHPGIWFDGYLRGSLDQGIRGVTFERLNQRLVLPAGQSVSRVVRVDTDALYPILHENPLTDYTINLSATSNPAGTAKAGPDNIEQAVPALCGYTVELTKLLERLPLRISSQDDRLALQEKLSNGDGGDRINAVEAMTIFLPSLVANPDAKPLWTDWERRIIAAQSDPSPAVRAAVKCMIASILSGPDRDAAIAKLQSDPDWQTRLTFLVYAPGLVADPAAVAAKLSSDPDASVSQYATAMAATLAAKAQLPIAAAKPIPGVVGMTPQSNDAVPGVPNPNQGTNNAPPPAPDNSGSGTGTPTPDNNPTPPPQ